MNYFVFTKCIYHENLGVNIGENIKYFTQDKNNIFNSEQLDKTLYESLSLPSANG